MIKIIIIMMLFCATINAEKQVKSWEYLKFKNTVRQTLDFTCGAASLATLLNLYDTQLKVSENEIMRILNKKKMSKDSIVGLNEKFFNEKYRISLLDLKIAAQKHGYAAFGLKVPFHKLKNLKIPAIVHMKTKKIDHFSVVTGYNDYYVELSDPSFGKITITHNKFKKMYLGNILIIKPKIGASKIPKLNTIKQTFNFYLSKRI
tara:strand:- start:4258 stop:4869 length:612 start_codon:yes stop_codon:yes gene_type:complete